MEILAGRNEPCPCGSGKKFKKCHGKKDVLSIAAVIDDELRAILERYITQYPVDPKEQFSYDMEMDKWLTELDGLWDDQTIGMIHLEHFLFSRRKDIWQDYLRKQIKSASRPAVKEALEQWMDPEIVIVEIVGGDEFTDARNIISGKIYRLALPQDSRAVKGEFAIATLLPEPRIGETCCSFVNLLTFVPSYLKPAITEVKSKAKQEKISSEVFFRENLLDILLLLKDFQQAEQELTPEQEVILYNLQKYLEQYDDVDEKLFTIFGLYLMGANPNPRKIEGLIAGAVRFGRDYHFLPDYQTNKELAEVFGVSTSTIQKYAEEIEDFYHLFAMDAVSQIQDPVSKPSVSPTIAYDVGISPRLTEYANWEIEMHMKHMDIKNEKDFELKLNQVMNVPYKPKTQKEQAQKNAYEGYFAKTEKLRKQHWKLAEEQDPNNPDVLLHKAELAKDEKQATKYYLKAIELAYNLYEEEIEHPWMYISNRYFLRALFAFGIFLFDCGEYEAATDVLQDIVLFNPEDQQGARYPLMASLIAVERNDEVEKYLKQYEWDNSAAYIFMKNALRHRRLEKVNVREMFEANQYATDLLLHPKDEYPLEYPKSAIIEPGSMEEAYYIYALLGDKFRGY